MKKIIMMAGALLFVAPSFAQVTVSFKPNAAVGEDATIWNLTGGCISSGLTVTPAYMNLGSNDDLAVSQWTWYSGNCSDGTNRTLIRFSELSTIPPTATIVSATLKLHTPPAGSGTWAAWCWNSYYPGSPYPNSNPGWLYRVTPGFNNASSPNNWNENTVTWATQPTITGTPAVIAPTTSQWNFTQNIDVTNIVQQIVTESATDAYANNGFLLKLQTEVYYRGHSYASSDYSDPAYWPELEVTYTNCNPAFSFSSNSSNPYKYTFSADDPNLQSSYKWEVNGLFAGNFPTMNHIFAGVGSYNICLTVTNAGQSCQRCISLCINQNPVWAFMAPPPQQALPAALTAVPKGVRIPGDDISQLNTGLRLDPNPTKDGWNIRFNAREKTPVTITVSDINGKVVATQTVNAVPGENTIYQPAVRLSSGMYFIELKGKTVSFKGKALKE